MVGLLEDMPSQGASSAIQIDTTLVPWKTGRYPGRRVQHLPRTKIFASSASSQPTTHETEGVDEAHEAGDERLKL